MNTRILNNKTANSFVIFFSIYFILYAFPFPILNDSSIFYNFIISILEYVPGLESLEKITNTGSGDSAFYFTVVLFLLIATFFITIIIKYFIKDNEKLNKIVSFSISYSKYFLAYYLMFYGFTKLNYGQFPFPDLMRLDQKLGDFSPMGLLWTFLGYSNTYSTFGAICEIFAGVLLLIRRTHILGALISFGVMLNVFILNISYDVPVKLFSLHLVLISIYIIHQHLYKIILFLTGHSAKLDFKRIELKNKWLKIGRILFISIVVFSASLFLFSINKISENQYLTGIYTTQNFEIKGTTNNKWEKFILENKKATIFLEDNSIHQYFAEIDSTKQILTLKYTINSSTKYHLNYKLKPENNLELKGIFLSDTIKANFKITKLKDFELMNRKFHWISEYPYNR